MFLENPVRRGRAANALHSLQQLLLSLSSCKGVLGKRKTRYKGVIRTEGIFDMGFLLFQGIICQIVDAYQRKQDGLDRNAAADYFSLDWRTIGR